MVVLENTQLIGTDIFIIWYRKESPNICDYTNLKKSDHLEDKKDDGEIPF
jgi:hypothetical protein